MAYSVDWISKIITIPTSDLVLVSGTRYQLPMADFLAECRRLEWEFTDGLWAPPILDHTNAKLAFAGVDYAGFDEVINGYTCQVTGAATRVDLLGSNNNIIDVLIVTGVSIVPSNSAGLQLVSTGSGLDAGQDTKLTRIYNLLDVIEGTLDHQEVMRILLAAAANKLSGAATTNVKIRDLADGKDRIDATVDADGNRTAVTLDAS